MKSRSLLIALLLLSLGAAEAGAQVAQKRTLTLEGARNVITAAAAYARTKAGTGVIAVVDDGGNLIAVERLDGTFAAGANISIGKARTAVLFKRPTKVFEDIIRNGRTPMLAVDFTPLQGGVPIVVDGEVVGGVGVSGAASAAEDEELAIAGAAAVSGVVRQAQGGAMGVSYFTHAQVQHAFANGGVLVDGRGRDYAVNASRRDRAGEAEVHVLDTDLIYVQEGTATFVTGGTVVHPKVTETNEIRGDAIEGGETRRISKGDVITIPNGTPHWFKDVRGPFTYYVVKVK